MSVFYAVFGLPVGLRSWTYIGKSNNLAARFRSHKAARESQPELRDWIARNHGRPSAVESFEAHQWAEQWGKYRGLVAFHIYAEMLRDSRI